MRNIAQLLPSKKPSTSARALISNLQRGYLLRSTETTIAFSSVFIFFEAFRLTLVKKNRQSEESRENVALYRK